MPGVRLPALILTAFALLLARVTNLKKTGSTRNHQTRGELSVNRPILDDMQISTVLLDLDGVVRHFDPRHVTLVEEKFRLTPGALTASAFTPNLLEQVITGRISRARWVDAVGHSVGSAAAAEEWMAELGYVDEEMLNEVESLRSADVVVAVLTNGTDTIPHEMDTLGIASRFDRIFNSAEIGFAKPDHQAFEHVCRELDVKPSEVFFTDDSVSKLGGAIDIGMAVRHFQDVKRFRHHLAELGLPPGTERSD